MKIEAKDAEDAGTEASAAMVEGGGAVVTAAATTIIATKPSSSPPLLLKRVSRTTLNLKTDISKDKRDSLSCGILHATKSNSSSRGGGGGEDEHAFVWVVDNIDNASVVSSLVAHLHEIGFRATKSQMRFIPYSSKAAWLARYPHAVPYLECDEDGTITGSLPPPPPRLEDYDDNAAKKKKKKTAKKKINAPPPKLIEGGCLPNAEREELHREIYSYFAWLHDELSMLETNRAGRRQVSMAGVSVPALRSLVAKMEGAFRGIQQKPSLLEKGNNNREGLPYLEQALETELQHKVIAKTKPDPLSTTEKSKATASRQGREASSWRQNDFDDMFQKLVTFQAEKGHTSPPVKHPELGRWVSKLRLNKKLLRDKGLEYEPEEEVGIPMVAAAVAEADVDTMLVSGETEAKADDDTMLAAETETKPEGSSTSSQQKKSATPRANTFLSKYRVNLLDSINFTWSVMPVRVTWEQRFEELRQFKEQNGRFPTNREGSLGDWLKSQRKLYTKKDADFMVKKFPKLEEIGVPLRQRNYFTALGWDDRFQQLVEFGRVNRHFNVPNPAPDNAEYRGLLQDLSSDTADANRFYKWVGRLHTEHKALQRGVVSTFLTEERVAQLQNIGFEFNTKQDKTVPEIDWSTRVQQLESFQSEMGHMRVDPNYDKCSNLGGWAVEISERHKNWREGREYIPPDLEEKFNHLSALGFGFDVFRSRRGERSWDDSFHLLLQFRRETGSCRVPHHYKADFRLGSWVAVQRKEYKMAVQGKPSRLTHERIQRLESVGFEFSARRVGGVDQQE
ncbi:hypothetical protein ACHAXR_004649 [Thalassiosira sp. AJA248-18]